VKILIIGSGGREHCLAWKLSKSDMVEEIYAIPGNAGISGIADCIDMGIGASDFKKIADMAEGKDIDMIVIGPEAPLVNGMSDYFEIAADMDQALQALDDCMGSRIFGDAGDRVMVEDFLEGYEVSVLCLSDGKKIIPMELAQDYKRNFDDDKGKNTGGMGSYSPVPMISEKIYNKTLETIIYPTSEALKEEGLDYRGIIYAGILVCQLHGAIRRLHQGAIL